jgi:hypothetical protein
MMKKGNPAIIGRWIVAALLWLLLFFCFGTSVRTNNIVSNALAHIDQTVNSESIKNERLVGEIAKEYALNWATFNNDRDDYIRRMSLYGLTVLTPPEGVQRCNSVSIISIDNSPEDKTIYRANLLINLSRIVTVNNDQYILPSPERMVSKEGDLTSYWKDFRESVEITLKLNDGKVDILGTPVSKPLQEQSGINPVEYIGFSDVPKDFKIFITQALELYFAGKNLDNYLGPNVELKPVGQYQVQDVVIEGFSWEKEKEFARAAVRVQLSTEGINHINQTIIIEAQKKDRWTLLRLGGY